MYVTVQFAHHFSSIALHKHQYLGSKIKYKIQITKQTLNDRSIIDILTYVTDQ